LIDLPVCRIAVLGAISWPPPPPGYGPWEQVAYNIGARSRASAATDVTLFADRRLIEPAESWRPSCRSG